MPSDCRWIVVGGGFRAIMGAHLLASQGCRVTLLAPGKRLGGVLTPIEWNGFHFDKGCHLFDNDDAAISQSLLEIMGDSYEPVQVKYASVINGRLTEGVAIPNLESYGVSLAEQILKEIRQIISNSPTPIHQRISIEDSLKARFGPTAGGLLARAVQKVYQASPGQLDGAALPMTLFERVKLLDDKQTMQLKNSDPEWDARLAASSQHDPVRFYRHQTGEYGFRNFYPKKGGMGGFCEQATQHLLSKGVEIKFQQTVTTITSGGARAITCGGRLFEADHILWAADPAQMAGAIGEEFQLKQHVHHVPMVLFYFVIPKLAEGEWTYLHDFDQDHLVFRASIPGSYVTNPPCPEGQSYVCVEVPTTECSPIWAEPQAWEKIIWDELTNHNIVCSRQPLATHTLSVSATYSLPKTSFYAAWQPVREKVAEFSNLLHADSWQFSKNNITRSLKEMLEVS